MLSKDRAWVSTFKRKTWWKIKVYIESYGCQMNFSDSEIIASILKKAGYSTTNSSQNADLILLNTCSIRDKAEQTIRKRLKQVNSYKATNPDLTVGVLGCMAERLKSKLLKEERIVDLVAGPDAYRNLPHLLDEVDNGNKFAWELSVATRRPL